MKIFKVLLSAIAGLGIALLVFVILAILMPAVFIEAAFKQNKWPWQLDLDEPPPIMQKPYYGYDVTF